jgi:phosphoenolpyruvate carboxykinase (ATP)
LVENICFSPNTNAIDFANRSITENTRASYPLHFIGNALEPSVTGIPKHIFFLTCDAYGVLPPISRLTAEQAMYQFISGYTAKTAGTETGITEPKATFSACFGAPFLPLHPAKYAALLRERITKNKVQVWMINTGWTGGGYGVGQRISLSYTRAMLTAALNGSLSEAAYSSHPVFDISVPQSCPGVPAALLNPRDTWADAAAYDKAAAALLQLFQQNFEKLSCSTKIY